MIAYPKGGSTLATQAVYFDFRSGDIGFRDMPETYCIEAGRLLQDVGTQNQWDGDPASWDSDMTQWNASVSLMSNDDVMIGTSLGVFCITNEQSTDFATGPVTAVIFKLGLAMGDTETRKQIYTLWPKVTGRTGDVLSFRVMSQDISGGPVTMSDPLPFAIGQQEPINLFLQGRWVGFEITSVGGAPWVMGSLDIEYQGVGKW
jgi:hypothetical protein